VPDELQQAVDEYGRGLDAEIALLQQIERVSEAQRAATAANELSDLRSVSEHRAGLMLSLVSLEAQVRPVRARLAGKLPLLWRLDGFEALAARHRQAEELVHRILSGDHATLEALQDAERARRLAAQVIETGEATLAAYRKVISPPPASAGLVSERG
jgi:hypothetical protein